MNTDVFPLSTKSLLPLSVALLHSVYVDPVSLDD